MLLLLLKNLRDIQKRPLRAVLTMVGVLLGVAGVVAISFSGRNLAEAQRQTYAGTRQPDITASVQNLSPSLIDLIEHRDNVAVVDSRAVQFTRVTVGQQWVNTMLTGVPDFYAFTLDSLELVSGRFPGHGEVAFDITTRKLIDVKLGDLVAIQANSSQPITYATVSGFVRVPATIDASLLNQGNAFMPSSDVRKLIGSQFDNFLMLRLDQPERASQTAQDIQSLLSKRGVVSGNYSIRDPHNFTGSRELGTLLLLLQVFSVVGAVLSSFLVSNTIAAVMIEQTRQIGVIKALGGTRWTVMKTYLAYALIIGVTGSMIGWALGLIAGQALSRYLAGLSGLILPSFSLSYRELALALVVGLGVTVGSAAIPAWVSSGQRVARLLANIGVRADFRRGTVQALTARLSGLGAMATIGLRNLARRPLRAWVTLAVVSVAVAAFLSTQAVSASVTTTVDELYGVYGAQGWIYFNRNVDQRFARQISDAPGVVRAEPWNSAQGAIGSRRVDVWGLPADTGVYQVRLSAGRWLAQAEPTGVVVTSPVARALDLQVGDLRTLDIGKRSVLVQVLGVVDDESTYLGATTAGKVFMRIEDLQGIVGSQGQASLFALKLQSQDHAEVDQILSALEQRYKQYGGATLAMYRDQASSKQAINILTLMLTAMVVIVSVVGLAGIVNTLVINLSERRREFGILRSIGASGWHLVRVVMAEAIGITLAGCLIGIATGYPLARYLVDLTGEQLFRLQFQLGPLTMIGTVLVALVATAAVSTGPGLIASRLKPIQVLRYE